MGTLDAVHPLRRCTYSEEPHCLATFQHVSFPEGRAGSAQSCWQCPVLLPPPTCPKSQCLSFMNEAWCAKARRRQKRQQTTLTSIAMASEGTTATAASSSWHIVWAPGLNAGRLGQQPAGQVRTRCLSNRFAQCRRLRHTTLFVPIATCVRCAPASGPRRRKRGPASSERRVSASLAAATLIEG